MLVPDGLYLTETETPYFRRLSATRDELQSLVELIVRRVGRHLERRGLLRRDAESSHLTFEPSGEAEGLADLQSHSVAAEETERDRLERLCRYISRPAPG